jgi:transposase
MTQLTEYEKLALHKLGESIHHGRWSNEGMVQLIELVGDYLNPLTISEYAEKYKMSYNGVKKCRKITKLLKIKLIIDND